MRIFLLKTYKRSHWILSSLVVNKLPVTIKSNLKFKKRFPITAMNFYLVKKKINILSFKFECLPISLYRALLIKEIYIAAMTIQPRLLNPHIFNGLFINRVTCPSVPPAKLQSPDFSPGWFRVEMKWWRNPKQIAMHPLVPSSAGSRAFRPGNTLSPDWTGKIPSSYLEHPAQHGCYVARSGATLYQRIQFELFCWNKFYLRFMVTILNELPK